MSVTKATPTKITLYTAPAWKKEMLRLAVEAASGGKLDMGALMKQAMASPSIAEHKKDAPNAPKSWPRRRTRSRLRRWGWTSSRRLLERRVTCRRRWPCLWRSTRRTRRGRTPRARASKRNRGGRRFILSERMAEDRALWVLNLGRRN